MKRISELKIDAYSHITPQKYAEALRKIAPELHNEKVVQNVPLYDMEQRFRIMDKYENLVQVLTLGWPAVEEVEAFANSGKVVDIAKLANDEMAELVLKYPDRFIAAIACLPLNNIDAALKEVDRVISDLNLRGVLVYTNVNGKPLDSPEFMPLFERMAQYDLPIYIHPGRSSNFPDYSTENKSRYYIHSNFGWPYETTVAMTRLVFSSIMEKYPNLKVITHHCGGMVSFYEERIIQHYDILISRNKVSNKGFTKAPIEYYKMFYNDTAIHGNTPALMCAYAFWGADHLLFGADMPLGDAQFGAQSYRKTINAINQMDISDPEKKMIFQDNARKLMHLPI